MAIEYETFKDGGFKYALLKLKSTLTSLLSTKVNNTDTATDSTLGLVKTNAAQNISLNANGQLEVGGRIGQFEGTTGLFASNDRAPRAVGDYSLLITDAMGMALDTSRAFAVVSGLGPDCQSAPAGSTEYRVSNTYYNRLVCKMCEGGYASRDEATSKVELIVPVVSVTIDGQSFIPDSAPNDPTKDIVIKTAETLNPDSAITKLRLFGRMASYSTAHIGNGIASWGGGRNLFVGGAITKDGNGNNNCVVAEGVYVNGNGNSVSGRYHIVRKNRGFIAGTGHDTTNAMAEGASAVGLYSLLDPSILFAVGDGTSPTDRSNAFEVATSGLKGTVKNLDVPCIEQLAPRLIQANWGTNADFSFADDVLTFNGVSANRTCIARTNFVKSVTAGEILTVSFEAKKATADGAIGNLQIILAKTNSSGGSPTSNIVINKPSSDITTEWAEYSTTFIVPSGMEYMLPRVVKASGTVTPGQNYQIRNLSITRPNDGLCLFSPNETKWKLQVADDGTLSTTPVT